MDAQLFTDWFMTPTRVGISPMNASLAVGAALLSYFLMTFALRVVLARLERMAERSQNKVDDTLVELLKSTSRTLLALAALLIGLSMLDLPERWSSRVGHLWFIVLVLQFALWGSSAVTIVARRHAQRQAAAGSAVQLSASVTLLSWALRTLLWATVALAMLSNVGVNITAFVASLGVGGIAVALAVQNILGDLFASLAIALDKPFEVGDAIAVNGMSGTVERVGLKTTRLRALGGEQLVMSNADLLKNPVSNYKRQNERRVVFKFGLTYATTPEQAAMVPGIVKRVVTSHERLRFDRAHLMSLSESSLDYEVVYVVLESSYQLHMDLQQAVMIELMREFREAGVAFAYPTRTVVIEGGLPPSAAAPVDLNHAPH